MGPIELGICITVVWAVSISKWQWVLIKTEPKEGEGRTKWERLGKAWMFALLFPLVIILIAWAFHFLK